MGVAGQFGNPDPPLGIRTQRLVSDRFVCVVRDGHPIVKKRLSLDEFVSLPHALVAPRGESGSIVDTALAAWGRSAGSPWRSRTSSWRRTSCARRT